MITTNPAIQAQVMRFVNGVNWLRSRNCSTPTGKARHTHTIANQFMR